MCLSVRVCLRTCVRTCILCIAVLLPHKSIFKHNIRLSVDS